MGAEKTPKAKQPVLCDWEETNSQQWTDRAYSLMQEGKLRARIVELSGVTVLLVDGQCPRCGVDYTRTQPADAVASSVGHLRDPDATEVGRYRLETTTCGCDEGHPGRPTTVAGGCGVWFAVLVAQPS